ncbi:MAG TPA: rhodanese-like domain-containing protein [Candidatus Kapabacteria bacterium]|nr:rhodanese-like domain-containing protein [Candidatus Kapabacteria bacterium]
MMKHLAVFAMAAAMFAGTTMLHAQCSGDAKGHCSGSCRVSKSEKNSLSQLKTVTKDEVARLIKAGNVTVMDARSEDQYKAGHIEGAVMFSQAALPADKNAKLIFYCGGTRCPLSHQAAKKAADLGYKNIMVFSGGWAEWNKNS